MNDANTILISPLDWGLGHATRCVPIINHLINAGHNIIIAASGPSALLLKSSFPQLEHIEMPEIKIRYSKKRWMFRFVALCQWPKFNRLIKLEKKRINEILLTHTIDVIISDNRFGLFHSSVPSVIITHQLRIKTGLGNFFDNIMQAINYRKIHRFTECWIPDLPGRNNIAGELSHPFQAPEIPVRYIGLQSQIKITEGIQENNAILVLLSGPEPQRSILESIINNQLRSYSGSVTVVRGLPQGGAEIKQWPGIKYYNHLSGNKLNDEFSKAEFIICRSGYSSVMDFLLAGKRAVCIPTPGQTEQEYLANFLNRKKMAICAEQDNFSLLESLKNAKHLEVNISPLKVEIDFSKMVNNLARAFKQGKKKSPA